MSRQYSSSTPHLRRCAHLQVSPDRVSGLFWPRFRAFLAAFQGSFGRVSGLFWSCFRAILVVSGLFWPRFRALLWYGRASTELFNSLFWPIRALLAAFQGSFVVRVHVHRAFLQSLLADQGCFGRVSGLVCGASARSQSSFTVSFGRCRAALAAFQGSFVVRVHVHRALLQSLLADAGLFYRTCCRGSGAS